MKKFLRIFCDLSIAGAAAALPSSPALADVKAGVEAWSAGNYEAAVKEWQPRAAAGDPDALFNLAQAYKLGRGVKEDLGKAEEFYGKAAAKGHVQASDVYGLLLFQKGEHAKAMPYIEASSARGDPRAQYILGLALFNGDGIARDWIRAYALVSLAQQAGLPQAASGLAQMDQFIPIEDRQKSVAVAARLAAEAQATRARQTAAAELGNGAISPSSPAPEIVAAERAVGEAIRAASSASPATSGADYTRKPVPTAMTAKSPPPPAAKQTAPKQTVKPAPAPAKPGTASGQWRVQLGAFGIAGNAEALWARVRGRPELAGHGKLLVPAGRLTKLQAGGFASKAEAAAACARLSAGGFACVPARN